MDFQKGQDIGKTPSTGNFIWQACAKCGKERWVLTYFGKPRSTVCQTCWWEGHRWNKETRQKIQEHHKGFTRPHTDEEKLKTSNSMKEWHRTHQHPRKGKKASPETKSRMSLARQGSKHYNWKGGLTELVRGIRRSPEFYQWRKSVLERDNHTCQDCGAIKELDAHHIQAVIDYPKGIFEIDNGLTLCQDCHKRHTYWQRLNGKGKAKH